MKRLILPLFVLLLALISCRSAKQIIPPEPVVITNSDSVKVEYREIIIFDTVTVVANVPEQSDRQVVRDSTSHLETDYAESDAWICSDGTLGHSIRNKKKSIPFKVQVPNKSSEKATIYVKTIEVPVNVPTPIYIEREFTNWELFRLKAFWYLLGISLAGIAWILRKPLISILGNVLK